MKHTYAFFDVDGTLLNTKSMFSFHDYWYRRWNRLNGQAVSEEFEDVTAILRGLAENGAPRELINRRYYEFFAGRPVDTVTACAQAWSRSVLADPNLFVTEVVDELDGLRAKGVEPVFVSGSFKEILAPIADHLGVQEVLATSLLHVNGKYTGRFEAPQTIGDGKVAAIAEFLAHRAAEAADCWAFGDDVSDVPMLSAVGHPVAVIGDHALDSVARNRGWRLLHLAATEDLSLVHVNLSALVGEAI